MGLVRSGRPEGMPPAWSRRMRDAPSRTTSPAPATREVGVRRPSRCRFGSPGQYSRPRRRRPGGRRVGAGRPQCRPGTRRHACYGRPRQTAATRAVEPRGRPVPGCPGAGPPRPHRLPGTMPATHGSRPVSLGPSSAARVEEGHPSVPPAQAPPSGNTTGAARLLVARWCMARTTSIQCTSSGSSRQRKLSATGPSVGEPAGGPDQQPERQLLRVQRLDQPGVKPRDTPALAGLVVAVGRLGDEQDLVAKPRSQLPGHLVAVQPGSPTPSSATCGRNASTFSTPSRPLAATSTW